MFWLMEWGLAEEHYFISCAGGTYFLQFAIKGIIILHALHFLRKAGSQMCSPFISFPISNKWRESRGALGPNSRKDAVTNIFMIWNFVCDIALSAPDDCSSGSYFVVEVLPSEKEAWQQERQRR